VTPVRTVAGVGLGTALLSVLTGCSSDSSVGALSVSAPISAPPTASVSKNTPAPDAGLFGGSKPVSVATWWDAHPEAAPADLADRRLLFNEQGDGPKRFPGPDVRKYNQIIMVITCVKAAEYELRLQVLDGLSIATTSGTSCGGPSLSSYVSPTVEVVDKKTEVQVEIPAGTKYYVTLYGKRVT
jgi:hypothetical protein